MKDILYLNKIDWDHVQNEPLAGGDYPPAEYVKENVNKWDKWKGRLVMSYEVTNLIFTIAKCGLAVFFMFTMIEVSTQVKNGEIEPPFDLVTLNQLFIIIVGVFFALMLLKVVRVR